MYCLIVSLLLLLVINLQSSAQLKSENTFWKWTTWAVLQSVPSITYFEDRDENNSSLKFGLQWQLIPVSYSFNSNKYVSPVQLFFIKPSERFSGSVELFFQPEYVTGDFKYADLRKFMFKTGTRIIIPVAQDGEYLAYSLGMGYSYQKITDNVIKGGMTYEAAVYFLFGMMGVKFNYNMNTPSRYNLGLYFKYY